MGETYTFGIEEEYFLADAVTGASPSVAASDRFHASAADEIESAEHELLKRPGRVRVEAWHRCRRDL